MVKASAYNAGDPVRSLDQEDPLEKKMATHSSTLAWKIPWMEEQLGIPGSAQLASQTRDLTTWKCQSMLSGSLQPHGL